jgi:hypothetical protein
MINASAMSYVAMRGSAVSVPCNGCTLCCRHDLIVLKPSMGDDPSAYDCVPLSPKDVGPLAALQPPEDSRWRLRQVGGRCVYATPKGCRIHDRAPVVCREFDCRRMVRSLPASTLKRLVRQGAYNKDVVSRGRELNRRQQTRVPITASIDQRRVPRP